MYFPVPAPLSHHLRKKEGVFVAPGMPPGTMAAALFFIEASMLDCERFTARFSFSPATMSRGHGLTSGASPCASNRYMAHACSALVDSTARLISSLKRDEMLELFISKAAIHSGFSSP